MKVAKPALASGAAVAAMLSLSVWAWPHTPPLIPVHFGMDGTPDRLGSRAEALLLLPAAAAAVSALMAVLPAVMPRNSRLERSARPYVVTWLATIGLLLALHVAMTLRAVGTDLNVTRVAIAGLGALLVLIGNFLGKVRYNYAIGVRTPWTLASETVWDRTHRATAPWVMGGGLLLFLIAIGSMMAPGGTPLLVPAALVLGIAPMLGGAIYSFVLSRRLEAASR